MSKRIRWLGLILILCFAVVLVQLTNIQFKQASALSHSPSNPRNFTIYDNNRGDILASNGQVLAQSVRIPGAGSASYQYMREYPDGPLFSDIVGYYSIYYGTAGVEAEYNDYLILHSQPAQSLSQLLSPPPKTTDSVTLTVEPYLQQVAQNELAAVDNAHKDGAVVVMDVHTGAILAMYSSPNYDPNQLSSPDIATEKAAGAADAVPDDETFAPDQPLATQGTIAPGSTFKVVTTSAVYNLMPSLSNFNFPVAPCTGILPDSTKMICNDGATPQTADPCGGSISAMLPPSCDPGYAELGLALGGRTLYEQATLFGYDSIPPIDISGFFGSKVAISNFPTPDELSPSCGTGPLCVGLPGVAYSAFGQQDVTASALQNVMVGEGIANDGTIMTPHVMKEIRDSQGNVVETYTPAVYKHAVSPQAAAQVNTLMQAVVTRGTADGVGFPSSLDAAVKTGTAQTTDPITGVAETDDWMIGFAPANNPQVAVAVVVPYQYVSNSGAEVAGPIVKCMMEAALNPAEANNTSLCAS